MKHIKMQSSDEFNQIKIDYFSVAMLTAIVFIAIVVIGQALRQDDLNGAVIVFWMLIYNIQVIKIYKKSEVKLDE